MKSRAAVLARATEQPVTAPVPPSEWASFNPGEKIALRRSVGHLATGTVDALTEDGSVFWAQLDHGQGRIALHREDDVRVWRA